MAMGYREKNANLYPYLMNIYPFLTGINYNLIYYLKK